MTPMTEKIGPMLACAVGDAYGAGFEFAPPARVRKHNDLSGYIQHQKWKEMKPGHYTDDTQMAMGIAEHMLVNDVWSIPSLAARFVTGFHRDPRAGYAGPFYDFLKQTVDGGAFINNIRPHSDKSGGAMRAFPLGFYPDTHLVRDLAMFQASLTHATHNGMMAAAVAALMFHHRYHHLGDKNSLSEFLSDWTGLDFAKPWVGAVSSSGMDCVQAAVTAFLGNDSMGDVLKACVAFTGDVDTVAAIAMPAAAVCEDTAGWLPLVLIDGLENELLGRKFLQWMDEKLLDKFPSRSVVEEAKPVVKETVLTTSELATETPLLDFLFDDEDGD